ncbi:MAG TPA: type III-B CRISPR module RAMP protein Cmr1, partial [Candidatus Xenobia bacterium]
MQIRVVTPILGGGYRTRQLDDVDIIRAATIRGHLRFWWRALQGHTYVDAVQLHQAEGLLWGKAATEEGGRSQIEIHVDNVIPTEIDRT